MSTGQEIINEDKMQEFATALESITGSDTLLAIDIFFVHKYKETQIKSLTYAKQVYIDIVLPDFISNYGSIGGIDNWKLEYKSYSENNNNTENGSMVFREFPFEDVAQTRATFESYTEHLKKKRYGKFCFWNNIHQKVGEAETNISVVVITANDNADKVDKIKTVVYESLLKEFYRLIINKFVEISIEQNKKLIQHERDKEFVKAHKHTIRNFGLELSLANIDAALENNKIQKAKEILSRVQKLNLIRDISIDFIYRANSSSSSKNKLLLLDELNRRGGLKYSEILKIINDAATDDTSYLEIASQIENNTLNIIKEENLVPVFNLLVNLYSNAEKHSNKFKVAMNIIDGKLFIDFINYSQINDKSIIQALIHKDISQVTDMNKVGDGLSIIIESLNTLNYSLSVTTDDNSTKISLKTN